jgi:hypothetical protein
MIDEQLLRDAGWSDELIEAAMRVATNINRGQKSVGANRLELDTTHSFLESNTITLNSNSAEEFSWPPLR